MSIAFDKLNELLKNSFSPDKAKVVTAKYSNEDPKKIRMEWKIGFLNQNQNYSLSICFEFPFDMDSLQARKDLTIHDVEVEFQLDYEKLIPIAINHDYKSLAEKIHKRRGTILTDDLGISS